MNRGRADAAPWVYEIRLQGILCIDWSQWFDGISVTHDLEGSTTLLTGAEIDQAAREGLLDRIRGLGLILLAVRRIDEKDDDTARSTD